MFAFRESLRPELLPPPQSGMDLVGVELSVGEMLKMNLSPLDPNVPAAIRPLRWSPEEPIVDTAELRGRLVPDLEVLRLTREQMEGMDVTLAGSLLDEREGAAIPTPVWMIEYWVWQRKAGVVKREAERAVGWLREQQAKGGVLRRAATEALESLLELQWLDNGLAGGMVETREVLTLLGGQYMTSSTLDAMIARLNSRLQGSPHLASRFVVANTMVRLDIGRYCTQEGGTSNERMGRELERLVDVIKENSALTMVLVPWLAREPARWVVFALDVAQKEIGYADCLGQDADDEDLELLQRWLKQGGLGEWGVGKKLPCGGPDEGISCGLLAVNAIKHAVFGDVLATEATWDLMAVEEYLGLVKAGGRVLRQSPGDSE